MTTTTARCTSTFCGLPGQHYPDCPCQGCRGCLPALAAGRRLLCYRCIDKIREDPPALAVLYTDLEQVLMRRMPGASPGGTSSGAPVPDDTVMEAREQIRCLLARLSGRIVRERGVTGPTQLYLKRLPHGVEGPRARARRPVDDPASQAAFIAKHADWLAAQPDAADVAAELRALASDRRLTAITYPTRASRLFLGHCPLTVRDVDGNESICGERLYHYGDAALVDCPGCSTQETVEQWRHWLVPAAQPEVDAYAGAADLAGRWYRDVDPAMLRQWASRGWVRPVMELNPDHDDAACAHCAAARQDVAEGREPQPCPDKHRVKRIKRRTMYWLDELRQRARALWGGEPLLPGGLATT